MKRKNLAILFLTIIIIVGIVFIVKPKGDNITGDAVQGTEDIKVLRMGLIPADDAEEMLRDYEPVRQYLSQKLGIPVEIQVTSDYTAAIEAIRGKPLYDKLPEEQKKNFSTGWNLLHFQKLFTDLIRKLDNMKNIKPLIIRSIQITT